MWSIFSLQYFLYFRVYNLLHLRFTAVFRKGVTSVGYTARGVNVSFSTWALRKSYGKRYVTFPKNMVYYVRMKTTNNNDLEKDVNLTCMIHCI
jgi:hypothetical protein